MYKFDEFELKMVDHLAYKKYFQLINKNRDRLKEYFPNTLKAVQTEAQALNYLIQLQAQNEKKEIYPFGIYSKEQLLGWISIKNIDWRIPKCELGYYIDQSIERKGVMSKALKAIIDYCFETLKMEKIFLRIGVENIPSKRLAIKNGFKQEGILRKDFRTGKGLVDVVYYGKLRNENE